MLGLQFSSQTHLSKAARSLWISLKVSSSPGFVGCLVFQILNWMASHDCCKSTPALPRSYPMQGSSNLTAEREGHVRDSFFNPNDITKSHHVEHWKDVSSDLLIRVRKLKAKSCRKKQLPCWPGTQWPIVQPGVRSY